MRPVRLRFAAIAAACLCLAPIGVANAAGRALSVSPSHVSLSTIQGTPAYTEVAIENTTTGPIDFSWEVTPTDQGWSPYQLFNCDSPLAAGVTCTIVLQLSVATGHWSAQLVVNDLTNSASTTVRLRGTVTDTAPTPLSLSPSRINLSTTEGTPAYADVAITNTGTSPISFNWEVTPSDQGWSPYSTFDCGSTLAGGETCTLTLQLSVAAGRWTAELIVHDLTNGTSKSVRLRGTVT